MGSIRGQVKVKQVGLGKGHSPQVEVRVWVKQRKIGVNQSSGIKKGINAHIKDFPYSFFLTLLFKNIIKSKPISSHGRGM